MGNPTALRVQNSTHTGPDPRIDVDICEPARGDDVYWIVSHSQGQWFAKREVHGERTYTVHLLHDSGEPGQRRDFLIVAGRTSSGRQWLRANLAADEAGAPFDRENRPSGVEVVSDPYSSTS